MLKKKKEVVRGFRPYPPEREPHHRSAGEE
jgi:hypothetical protein